MNVGEWLAIIGAVTVSITSIVAAVGTVIVAVRQGHMKEAVDHTLMLTNSHNDKLRQLTQDQAATIHEAGLPPTQDASLKSSLSDPPMA